MAYRPPTIDLADVESNAEPVARPARNELRRPHRVERRFGQDALTLRRHPAPDENFDKTAEVEDSAVETGARADTKPKRWRGEIAAVHRPHFTFHQLGSHRR